MPKQGQRQLNTGNDYRLSDDNAEDDHALSGKNEDLFYFTCINTIKKPFISVSLSKLY